MRLTYLGHSCFLIETKNDSGVSTRLLIDPFFFDPPASVIHADEVRCDYLLLSHGHEDHCCEALNIARRNEATIIANFEITEFYAAQGARTHGLNPGGGHVFPFGHVKLTPARHSSSQGDPLNPIYLGEACGILITSEGRRVYHAGDTGIFLDMELISDPPLDLAILPIGDNFTMGPDDAIQALGLLRPKLCVPMHYNTWPHIRQDAPQFAANAALAGHTVKIMAPGETITL